MGITFHSDVLYNISSYEMFLVNKKHLSSCPVTLLFMLPQVLDGALSVPCHL